MGYLVYPKLVVLAGFEDNSKNYSYRIKRKGGVLMRLSKLTGFIGLFIIISAAFMRQLMDFTKLYTGERGFIVLIGLLSLIGGLTFLIFALKAKPSLIRILGVITVLAIGLSLAWQIKIVVERIHILEYGFLGWFASRDLIRGRSKKLKGIILACLLATAVGIIDEVFQAILPYRFFDLRDILFNSLGGIWGIVLYLSGS